MSEFKDRHIVVTGAAGGLGRATVQRFLQEGASVLAVDIDGGRLADAQALWQPTAAVGGGRLQTQVSGLDSPQACVEVLARVAAPIDALVHLAGTLEPDFLDLDRRDVWDRTVASHLTNAFDLCAAYHRHRRDRPQPGRIVLTSSIAYRRGSGEYTAYSAVKGGLVGMARALSRKLAPQVLVNAIAPGIIETPMTTEVRASSERELLGRIPLGRFGVPDDVAGVIRFLCSRDAAYITGQTLTIDGGMTNA